MSDSLKIKILDLLENGFANREAEARQAFAQLRQALNAGAVRAAEPDGEAWRLHEWVRQGILLGFRCGRNRAVPESGNPQARDRDTLPLRAVELMDERSRLIPGGSSIRDGAWIGKGVVCVPPMYINIGAWVGDESMIDSHALIGSCAQIGAGCHISAAAQIGGVLEPAGAWPVIIEDNVFVGAGSCVVEGVLVRKNAVIGAGVTLTSSTPVYDLVRQQVYRPAQGGPLIIPARAVVVPGARPARGDFAREHGIQVATPVIVKYVGDEQDRDFVEDALR